MNVPVLMYHAVGPERSTITIRPEVFAAQMRWLDEAGACVFSLRSLAELFRTGKQPPERCVVITFDDGFQSVYEHAFPILRAYRFPATVFLVADAIGTDNRWAGQPAGIPVLPLLDASQIQEMARAGIEFGSHTRSHPRLDRLAPGQLNGEILGSRKILEERLGLPIETLAYPYGRYNPEVLSLVRQGYCGACTTELAIARAGADPYEIARVDAYYLQTLPLFRQLFSPSLAGYLAVRRTARKVRQRFAH